MTAEFVVVLPAVIVVLACCLAAVAAVGFQVRLADAAAIGSRSLARGEPFEVAAQRVHALVGDVRVETERRGEFVCLKLSSAGVDSERMGPARLLGFTATAQGCALAGGL